MEQLLKLIETNPTLTPKQLAVMLNRDEQQVKDMIDDCTAKGIIKGYRAIIDWEKTDRAMVKALIELKVTPKKGRGFDEIAMAIASMDEVEGVTLMSGGYDLLVNMKARTMRQLALFVAEKLSTIEHVISTATHFVLRKYKDKGVIYANDIKTMHAFTADFAELAAGSWPWQGAWTKIPNAYKLTYRSNDSGDDLIFSKPFSRYEIYGFDGASSSTYDLSTCWITPLSITTILVAIVRASV